MDLTIQGDVIVAVQEVSTVNYLIDAQYITVQSLAGAVYLPTGPVVEYGNVNYQKYSLRCNPPLDLDLYEIEEYLCGKEIKVKEIIIQNSEKHT